LSDITLVWLSPQTPLPMMWSFVILVLRLAHEMEKYYLGIDLTTPISLMNWSNIILFFFKMKRFLKKSLP